MTVMYIFFSETPCLELQDTNADMFNDSSLIQFIVFCLVRFTKASDYKILTAFSIRLIEKIMMGEYLSGEI